MLWKKKRLLNDYTAKKAILETYDLLKPHFEEFYKKRPQKDMLISIRV